ncbi:MAG: T9SS type A sorting domain-containing protein [Bacteroidetes bacterium]|nr:T9SS type A sorting domain-containing protein [Bacteroidota bacterium]
MNKLLLIVLLLTSSVCELSGQASLPVIWQKTRKSSLSGGNAEGWGVDFDHKGNVYWPVSVDSANTNRQYDVFTYKYNPAGSQKWVSTYGGAGLQHAFVCHARDSFLYVGGRQNVQIPYWTTECNMLLLKMDTGTGSLVKSKEIPFGTGGYDEMDDIVPNGKDILVTGWAQAIPGVGNYDMGFARLDYSLNILKSGTFGNPSTGHAEHQDGHIYVQDTVFYACGLWDGHSGINNIADGRCFLGKFNRNTLELMDSVLFGPSLAAALDIQNPLGLCGDGQSVYVTGYSQPVVISDMQLLLAKFDTDLNLKWVRYLGGSGAETARGIVVADGKILVAGAANTGTIAPNGGYDGVLWVVDTSGNLQRYYHWGDNRDNEFRDISVWDDKIAIAGSTGTNLFSGGKSEDAFLIYSSLQSIGLSTKWPEKQLRIFPNPASNTLTLHGLSGSGYISLSSADGRLLRLERTESNTFHFDISSFRPGVYILRATTADKTISGSLQIVR